MFFFCGILIGTSIRSWLRKRSFKNFLSVIAPLIFAVYWTVMIAIIWYRQYMRSDLQIARIFVLIAFVLSAIDLVAAVLKFTVHKETSRRFAHASLALVLAGYLLIFAMTASSVMTILRELRSEYQVYTGSEAELSEQIKERTEPDAVILANSYHWNLVTPLTGRSIVTGTGTFLYYHGINTSQRENDVRQMYEHPFENAELFSQYNVRYILVSNVERHNYDIDQSFLQNCEIVAENGSGTLYRYP